MKKLIVLLFCAGLLLPGCASYTAVNEPIKSQSTGAIISENLTVIAGVGMAKVNGSKSWDPKIGGLIGVETKLHEINKESSLNVGVNLSFQGANYTESYDIEPYYQSLKSTHAALNEFSGTVNMTYINVPFMYYYKCNAGFYGEIGLQPSFLISAKDKPDDGSSYDFKDYINTFEIGIPLGIGYSINNQLSVGARAVFGLSNINSDGNEMYSSDDKDRNFILFGVVNYKLTK